MLIACTPKSHKVEFTPKSHKVEFDSATGTLTCRPEYRVVSDSQYSNYFFVQQKCKDDKLSLWDDLGVSVDDKTLAINHAKQLSSVPYPGCGYCTSSEKQVWP